MRIFVLWQYTELYRNGDMKMNDFRVIYTLKNVGFGVYTLSAILLS